MARPEARVELPKTNKVFTCSHDGHYLTGYSVIVAISRGQARELLIEELARNGLELTDEIEFKEIDLIRRQAIVLFNGDY